MSFDPVTALRAYHDALNAHDVEAIATMIADDIRYVSNGLGAVQGRDNLLASLRAYFAKHPDHTAWDDDVKPTGSHSATARWQLTTGEIRRRGIEQISFNELGLITEIIVQDE